MQEWRCVEGIGRLVACSVTVEVGWGVFALDVVV